MADRLELGKLDLVGEKKIQVGNKDLRQVDLNEVKNTFGKD